MPLYPYQPEVPCLTSRYPFNSTWARKTIFFHCPKSVCTHTETQIHKRKNGGVSNKWSGLAAFLSLEPWDFSPHSETTRQPMGTQGQQVAWPRKPDWNFYLFWFKDTDKAKSRDITKEITAHPQPHHERIQVRQSDTKGTLKINLHLKSQLTEIE